MTLPDSSKPRWLRLSGLACASLCLLTLAACSSAPEVVAGPPQIIEVPKLVHLPAECGKLELVRTEGATALEVMERQHAAIVAYELRVAACFRK